MEEKVTKKFLLYFRLALLVWILIVNAILHAMNFEYSWLIFISNIMLFTMEGDMKDRLQKSGEFFAPHVSKRETRRGLFFKTFPSPSRSSFSARPPGTAAHPPHGGGYRRR
jgi:hypothetical protein